MNYSALTNWRYLKTKINIIKKYIMQLNELHIQNFRCFTDYRITFASGLTVLFGKNGTGKTTLIHAIHKALSFAFKRDKEEKALNLGAGFPDLKPRDYSTLGTRRLSRISRRLSWTVAWVLHQRTTVKSYA